MRAFFRLSAFACALAITSAAFAQFDYTFAPPNDGSTGYWSNAANWTPSGGPPYEDDSATIPSGKTCIVDDTRRVDYFVIETGEDGVGTLEITGNGYLRVFGGSPCVVDGRLFFDTSSDLPTIELDGYVTLDGSGFVDARRPSSESTGTANIKRFFEGPSDLSISSNVEIYGSVEITAILENNGYLAVDSAYDTMQVSGYMYGTGDLDLSAGTFTVGDASEDHTNWNINVHGGDLELFGSHAYCRSLITVSSGTVQVDSSTGLAFHPSYTDGLNISGGTVTLDSTFLWGPVTISGGTLTFNEEVGGHGAAVTFTSTGGTTNFNAASSADMGFTVSGGTIYVNDTLNIDTLSWNSGGAFVVDTNQSVVFGQ